MNELLLCFYPSGGRVVFRDLFKTDSGGSGFGEVQTLKSQQRKDNMRNWKKQATQGKGENGNDE